VKRRVRLAVRTAKQPDRLIRPQHLDLDPATPGLFKHSAYHGSAPCAPVPMARLEHFHGIFSSTESGVWPHSSRNCFEFFSSADAPPPGR
jgi:hypothetical protein